MSGSPGLPQSPKQIRNTERVKEDSSERRAKRERTEASEQAEKVIRRFKAKVTDPVFVYFIQQYDLEEVSSGFAAGPVKIGVANDPYVRLRELQCGNPNGLCIVEAILGDSSLEHDLHIQFDDQRVRGEWFGPFFQGFENVILAMAAEAARRQLESLKAGHGIDYIRDTLPRDVFQGEDSQRITSMDRALYKIRWAA